MKEKIKIVRAVTIANSVVFFKDLIPQLLEQGYEVITISSEGPQLNSVSEVGGRIIPVQMERSISPFKDLKALYKLIKVFYKECPTIVHSMTPKAGLLCMIAAKLTRVPIRVHTFTGLVFPTSTGMKRKILMATDWLTCFCATHVIPEGEGVKEDLINYGITKKPIKVLGYGNCKGIDLRKFDPDLSSVKEEASKIRKKGIFSFVFIGRLVGDKGVNELVEAFIKLNIDIPNTRLLLIGGKEQNLDPLKKDTLQRIEKHPCIESVGIQKDVRPWLLASDVFILPSYREGFPNVVIEAGAMGLPSIVTDINGSREIIIEGQNGKIIPAKDTECLYNTMKFFVNNSEIRNKMAKNARPLIASRYEQSFVQQCIKNFYKEILNETL